MPMLYRTKSRDGYTVVHVAGCRILKRTQNIWSWEWALGKPLDVIYADAWNRPCKICGGGY